MLTKRLSQSRKAPKHLRVIPLSTSPIPFVVLRTLVPRLLLRRLSCLDSASEILERHASLDMCFGTPGVFSVSFQAYICQCVPISNEVGEVDTRVNIFVSLDKMNFVVKSQLMYGV